MYKAKHVLTIAFLTFCATMSMTGRNNTNSLVGAEKKFAATSDELYLFKDGEWDASLGTVTYNGTNKFNAEKKTWEIAASTWDAGHNVTFSNAFNLGAWKTLTLTMTDTAG